MFQVSRNGASQAGKSTYPSPKKLAEAPFGSNSLDCFIKIVAPAKQKVPACIIGACNDALRASTQSSQSAKDEPPTAPKAWKWVASTCDKERANFAKLIGKTLSNAQGKTVWQLLVATGDLDSMSVVVRLIPVTRGSPNATWQGLVRYGNSVFEHNPFRETACYMETDTQQFAGNLSECRPYAACFPPYNIQGPGIVRRNSNTEYRGEFANGQASGLGLATYPNGYRLEGTWVDGCLQGYGRLTLLNGASFEGEITTTEGTIPNSFIGRLQHDDGEQTLFHYGSHAMTLLPHAAHGAVKAARIAELHSELATWRSFMPQTSESVNLIDF